jgi:hypothetical protein
MTKELKIRVEDVFENPFENKKRFRKGISC